VADQGEMRAAADEVLNTKSIPPIEDAFDAAFVSVPRNAWLSAVALACVFRAEHPADDAGPVAATPDGGRNAQAR
jgi:hypothetical protein